MAERKPGDHHDYCHNPVTAECAICGYHMDHPMHGPPHQCPRPSPEAVAAARRIRAARLYIGVEPDDVWTLRDEILRLSGEEIR